MEDRILGAFLRKQHDEAMALAGSSDLLNLMPFAGSAGDPPDKYVAQFGCTGFVKGRQAPVTVANAFTVGISFPQDYLARADPFSILTWLEPLTVFHPNIRAPFVCVGRIAPGTPIVDLLYQVFEIITYTKVTMREDDALNKEACAWARQNPHRFPVDRRPLKRRALNLDVAAVAQTRPA